MTSALLSISVDRFILDGEFESESYYCWDLLHAASVDLSLYAYTHRYQVLQAFAPCPLVTVLPSWTTQVDKERIVFEFLFNGAEGITFKDSNAPYCPGRAGQHFKLKFEKTATVRVRTIDPERDSARIEMLDGAAWREVSGLKVENGTVQPGEFVEVRYLSATAEKRLTQSIFLRVRHDVSEQDCAIEQIRLSGRWHKGSSKSS